MNEPLCPYIRRAMYDILEPGLIIKERVIFDYELLYIKEGNATVTIEKNTYVSQVGDIFIFRPRQQHSIHVSSKTKFVQPHVHFDLLFRKDREEIPISFKNLDELSPKELSMFHSDILDRFFTPFPVLLHPHSPKHVELMLFELIHEYEHPSTYSEIRLSRLFLHLWEQVLNEVKYNFDSIQICKDNYAEKIKFFIEQHITRSLSVEEITELSHLSESHIFRIFREAYNISPMQYHALLRVERAKEMIRNTNMTITEVAERLGFSYVQDFCRVFKKIDGSAPSTYRDINIK